MKILLFGKNGQLGFELQRNMSDLGQIIALKTDDIILCGDLTNLEGIRQTIRTVKPDIILNAAAYTNVDKAESEVARAHLINAEAVGVMATTGKEVDSLLVHYSTDYVFDGIGTVPWVETDTPRPLNVYGLTKLAGEELIEDSGCRAFIFRASWLYSDRGHNFIKTILRLAQTRDHLEVVDDQIGAPTKTSMLAEMTACALTKIQSSDTGLYHLTASGSTSWFEYARLIVETALNAGKDLKLKPDGIIPVSSKAFPSAALRPLNSRLNTKKFEKNFGVSLPPWRESVVATVEKICDAI